MTPYYFNALIPREALRGFSATAKLQRIVNEPDRIPEIDDCGNLSPVNNAADIFIDFTVGCDGSALVGRDYHWNFAAVTVCFGDEFTIVLERGPLLFIGKRKAPAGEKVNVEVNYA